MLESINNLGEGAVAGTIAIWTEFAAFVPNLIAALFILLVGYVVAKIVSARLSPPGTGKKSLYPTRRSSTSPCGSRYCLQIRKRR